MEAILWEYNARLETGDADDVATLESLAAAIGPASELKLDLCIYYDFGDEVSDDVSDEVSDDVDGYGNGYSHGGQNLLRVLHFVFLSFTRRHWRVQVVRSAWIRCSRSCLIHGAAW